MSLFAKSQGDEEFDASKFPIVAMNVIGDVQIKICDPYLVQEMYTKHNKLTEKGGKFKDFMYPMFGESFIFAKSD